MRLLKRPQTAGEELANAISHGVGCVLAIVALPLLAVSALRHGSAQDVVAVSIFGVTMILMYLTSTLYHALPQGRLKAWLHRADHAAIYLFIAGSYTPFTLGVLRGGWGWSLFAVVWAIALTGVALKGFARLGSPVVSTALYLLMGWLIVVAAGQLVEKMPLPGLLWLLAGGLSYTLGAVVYVFDGRIRYGHCLWHVLVMAGTACHFWAALRYSH